MKLPDWLEPLLDASEQRDLDEWAIEDRGIPGGELMERAGAGLAGLCAEHVPEGRIVVVCGKGNNGGDGLVAARILRERHSRDVDVHLLAAPGELAGDVAANLSRLPGPAPQAFDPRALDGAALIVDAVLGTGFSGEPREPALGAIRAMNASGVPIVACDVPSGVDASTGEVASEAARAVATATFHAAKPGLWITPGKEHAGRTTVIDIGIPAERPDDAPPSDDPSVGLITEDVLRAIPRRSAGSTKFSAGSVLVCGGSPGLTGAPAMASLSAARAGAGYVTVAVPSRLAPILAAKLLEIMSAELPEEEDDTLGQRATDTVRERSERVQAMVLGPGLGREDASFAFAREVAAKAETPLVLDADGLNAHAGHLDTLAERPAPTILTPHAGELARLIDADSEAIAARRLHHARDAAARTRAIVVLKGDDTIVAEPEGRVAVSPGRAPALATAGTGDVLSGVIAAHLAKGMEPFDAACAGVFVHLSAGRLAAERIGPEGVMAGDVIELLPAVLAAPTS